MTMAKYKVRLGTKINLVVEIDAEDEEQAADEAWEHAEEYLRTITGDSSGGRRVYAEATLDGIGADEVEEIAS